ncbi:glucose-6-phosphate dehydrogenase [Candidatus Woesearchaeota archaeon]|nr:glucose-6-phosphate dehydrogenase [Candidatus Woesearchaeota archaeon]
MANKIENQLIVIFGSTGDLTKKKLIPALYKLFLKDKLNKNAPIVCTGRKNLTKEQYIKLLSFKPADNKSLGDFFRLVEYYKINIEENDFCDLENYLDKIDKKYRCKGNKVFYFSTPSSLFEPITKWIKKCGILKSGGFKRVVYEKPFGYDLKSAQKLNKIVRRIFKEKEIFRIDHYLGKELVQNIITLRFANSLFERIWNKRFIDYVQIIISEKEGVGSRGGYYDKAGATRDMVQNHLLQVLSFVAMNHPKSLSAKELSKEKVKVIKSLKRIKPTEVVIGQYKGYRKEKNVDKNSKTETFVALKTGLSNANWSGVPFYLMTGKSLSSSYAEVNIVLKDTMCHLFPKKEDNVISVRIQPDEGIAMQFNAKQPNTDNIATVLMEFCHACEFGMATPEAYEKLLNEIMVGDQTLFTSWPEVKAAWKFTDPLIETIKDKKLVFYNKGEACPKAAKDLIQKDGRQWLHVERKIKH